ncbi:toll-like receptor 8 [Alligator mississippiensis]|uniref:toll-like receptor 8 n=1 Tax=Alligator mississippiensis TaxID=8496 RepID=UPI0003D07991|nr:toll-like receptor 8 [Alligator mississippiensis]
MATIPYDLFVLLLLIQPEVSLSVHHQWISKDRPCKIKAKNNSSSILLDCSKQKLAAVPQEIHENVTDLILSFNWIKEISTKDFYNFKDLRSLKLNWNWYVKPKESYFDFSLKPLGIANGTFSNLRYLKELKLNGNQLNKVPTGISPSITALSLKSNKIVSIQKNTFSELPNLQELYMDENCYYGNACEASFNIETGAFSVLTNLIVLSLSYNSLTRVPAELPLSLQELYLSHNKIRTISQDDFKKLVNLKVLDLSENCPKHFNTLFPCEPYSGNSAIQINPLAFQNLNKLKTLLLTGNSLMNVPSTWFQNTPQLEVLHLASNFLRKAIATGEFLQHVSSLEELDLSFNYQKQVYSQYLNLSQYFSFLVSLKRLYIKGYVFKELDRQHLKPLFPLKKLKILDLGINFIKRVDISVFQEFSNLTQIYLKQNQIVPQTTEKTISFKSLEKKDLLTNSHYTFIHKDNSSLLEYSYNNKKHSNYFLSQHCISYGKALDLSLNNIFFITPDQFKGFEDIACLNLSSNALGQAFKGTELIILPNLKYLDLSFNKLDLTSFSVFKELPNLEVLDLSYNKRYFVVPDFEHQLMFIDNFPNLKILNLSWNEISSLTTSKLRSISLKKLDFKGNNLGYLWKNGDTSHIQLFKHLRNLTHLDISHNRLRNIPIKVFENLPWSLTELYINNNKIHTLSWEKLRYFKSLKLLDLTQNKFKAVDVLYNYTQSLQTLKLRENKISKISFVFSKRVSSLLYLDLSYNQLEVLNQSTFLSGIIQHLKVFKLKGNPFDCTCKNSNFIRWIQKTKVPISQVARNVICMNPDNERRRSIILIDPYACNLDDVSAILFYISSFITLSTMVIAVTKHFFYWDIWHKYYSCMAKLKGYRSTEKGKALYDAYIDYDTKDMAVTDWVINELRVHLEESEGKQVLLCLEERDWEPGKAVIDNLAQSIQCSRKTIFVLTERYVKNGNFRTAFYIALQRLMDENLDVIVFILLEPVLQHSQYLRLRRRIYKSSILDWPKNPRAEGLFWQSLKNTLLTDNTGHHKGVFSI